MRTASAALAGVLAACTTATPRYPSFDDVDYGFQTQTIHGKRAKLDIAYSVIGRGAKSPLIALHPWGFTMAVWSDVAPELAKDRRVVLVDLPGHGKSAKPESAVSMKRLGAAVLDVMDAAGVDRAILVGNSLGGATSLEVALLAPDRVRALVLVSAPGGAPFPGVVTQATRQIATPRQMATLSEEAWRIGLSTVPLGDSKTAQKITEDFIAMRDAKEWPQWCRSTIHILNSVANYAPALEHIRAPALVIHGNDDALITHDHSTEMAARLPEARLEVLDDCGHMSEVQCPKKVTEAILRFIGELENTAP